MGCPQLNDIYYGHRYYDADTGRWLSRDPIGESGGNNLYMMVKNNPIKYYDYLGREAKEDGDEDDGIDTSGIEGWDKLSDADKTKVKDILGRMQQGGETALGALADAGSILAKGGPMVTSIASGVATLGISIGFSIMSEILQGKIQTFTDKNIVCKQWKLWKSAKVNSPLKTELYRTFEDFVKPTFASALDDNKYANIKSGTCPGETSLNATWTPVFFKWIPHPDDKTKVYVSVFLPKITKTQIIPGDSLLIPSSLGGKGQWTECPCD